MKEYRWPVDELTRGILFFNSGTKHLTRLAVSLCSLRLHYHGPIVILDAGGSGGVVDKIAADDRLMVDVDRIPPLPAGADGKVLRNAVYVAKAGLWRHSPFREASLLVDSDTIFAADPSPLLDLAANRTKSGGLVVTRFSDWTTKTKLVVDRLKQWRMVKVRANGGGMRSIGVPWLLKLALGEAWPAVNTGVVGWAGPVNGNGNDGPGVLRDWERLSKAGQRCSFTDELAMQLLLGQHPHAMVGDEWNLSPLYSHGIERAKIIHFHGNKALHPAAAPIWLPLYRECCELNVGGIQSWTPAGDPALTEFLRA